jgi:hypothetical protein
MALQYRTSMTAVRYYPIGDPAIFGLPVEPAQEKGESAMALKATMLQNAGAYGDFRDHEFVSTRWEPIDPESVLLGGAAAAHPSAGGP